VDYYVTVHILLVNVIAVTTVYKLTVHILVADDIANDKNSLHNTIFSFVVF
jgi:hypothetical protein